MSRIGKKEIQIPSGVTVSVENRVVIVTGPKGKLTHSLRPEIKVEVLDNKIVTSLIKTTKGSTAFWGMTRAIINNMVIGVTSGFEKTLELVGVGYRAKQSTNGVSLTVGYSHPVEFNALEGTSIAVPDEKKIIITGIDKQTVGLTAALIRKIRKPEPYKGKGIRYVDEVVRRKAGKAGKV